MSFQRIVRPFLLSIEGNIGSGKTTLLTHLKEHFATHPEKYHNVILLKEPVHIWEATIIEDTGKNILQLFYEDPAKWAYQFQTLIFKTQKEQLDQAIASNPDCRLIISERSIDTGVKVFAKMLYDDNLIGKTDYHQYMEIVRNTPRKALDMVVYLRKPVDVCFHQINHRSRKGENNIAIEYLEKCETYHDDWLFSFESLSIIENNRLDDVIGIVDDIMRDYA